MSTQASCLFLTFDQLKPKLNQYYFKPTFQPLGPFGRPGSLETWGPLWVLLMQYGFIHTFESCETILILE